jgi:hypothetical protein
MNLKDIYEEYLDYLTNMSDKELKELFERTMENSPVTALEEVVYCRDCIHRPFKEYSEMKAPKINGLTDYTCPFVCVDSYYTIIPDDDFFCKNGEKENE